MRFPEFTEVWKDSNIGKCFDLYSGNTPSRMEKKHFIGDVNWITSGELKEHYIGDTKERISEKAAEDNNLRILPVGTFVMAIYGLEAEGVRGTCSITVKTSTISQACMAFTPKSNVSNEFLYSWYKKHGNKIGIRYAQGTKQQNLSYDIIEKFPIRYPSIEEQEKLNTFISLLDKRIATQNKIIEQLQSLIKGIVVEHFNNTQKTKVKIKDLGKSYSVMNMSKEDLSETGNECIIYGELFTTYDCVAANIVSKTQKAVHSSTVSTGYDLLFPASTTVDAQSLIAPTAVSIPNIILGGDMFGIAVKQEFNNEYLSYAFNYIYKKHLAQYAQGSTIIHLHYNDIKNLYIGIPNKITQDKLVTLLKSMQDKILTEKKMLSMLETQKAHLLRNLFI